MCATNYPRPRHQVPYFLGVAAYCFEGTGLVLPLESSCARPSRFPALLVATLLAITLLEVSFFRASPRVRQLEPAYLCFLPSSSLSDSG